MLIILDGPDGGGKTTLANNLGQPVRHFEREHTFDDYVKLMSGRWPLDETFDRCWASAAIYEAIETGRDRFTVTYRMLERLALRSRAVLVLCLPPEEVCMANWSARIDQEKFKDEKRVRQFYRAWVRFTRTHLPVLTYDYTNESFWSLTARLQRVERNHYTRYPPPVDGAGHWLPGSTVLMLGEHGTNRPFVWEHGDALWLAKRLEAAGIPERGLYWANVERPNGKPLPAKILRELRHTKVVAMGKRAADWALAHGEPCVPFANPELRRRFRHHEHYALIEELQNDENLRDHRERLLTSRDTGGHPV